MSSDQVRGWWEDRGNLVLVTRFLADRGDSADAIAYCVEKPWKYEDEFHDAVSVYLNEHLTQENTEVPAVEPIHPDAKGSFLRLVPDEAQE